MSEGEVRLEGNPKQKPHTVMWGIIEIIIIIVVVVVVSTCSSRTFKNKE